MCGEIADLFLQSRQPPAEFGHLARQVARPACQARDLIVDCVAVALAAGHRIVEREHGEKAERRQGGIGGRKP